MSLSRTESTLLALSNDLAYAVEQVGSTVVAVNAQQRLPASGVHWRSGAIVTTDYVAKREEEITVKLPDGRTVPATLAGHDPGTDIAVLKLQGVELPVAEIGDASLLKVGHIVLAVGRSGESGLAASLGIVSAKGGTWRSWYGGQIDQFIRLDLTLYPGFAGGPLVDASGRVMGMNTSGPRRLVLTIPASTVDRVVDRLLEKGRIARGYLGLGMQPVRLPDNLKQKLNLPTSGGAIVVDIAANGPADRAGMTIGDVIVALGGTAVNDTEDVQAMLGPEQVEQTLKAQIVRGGTLLELAIVVGERPCRGE